MKLILAPLFFVVVGSFSAPAAVLYSFSQPAFPPGDLPTMNFDFTVPSLLTSSTLIPGSDINSPIIDFEGLELSMLSVMIDPGLNSDAPYIGSRGVASMIISTGWGSEVVFGEGVCFDSNRSCYSGLSPVGGQAFDHLGTYTSEGTSLTISLTATPQTVTPEPRFETVAGFLGLLTAVGIARRTDYSLQPKCRPENVI